MKNVAAATAMLLVLPLAPVTAMPPPPPQEKHALEWKPAEKRIVVVKLKSVTLAFTGKDEMISHESEAELSPIPGDSPAGQPYVVRVNRLHLKKRDGENIVELKFERDKEPVFEGAEPPRDLKNLARELAGDHRTVISGFGRFEAIQDGNRVLMVSLGRVDAQLPMMPVASSTTWQTDVRISFPGAEFTGPLTHAFKKIAKSDKGKFALIRVTAAEGGKPPGESALKWEGTGEMTYSFEDRLISDFKFKLTQKDKEGKIVRSLEQEVSITLKP